MLNFWRPPTERPSVSRPMTYGRCPPRRKGQELTRRAELAISIRNGGARGPRTSPADVGVSRFARTPTRASRENEEATVVPSRQMARAVVEVSDGLPRPCARIRVPRRTRGVGGLEGAPETGARSTPSGPAPVRFRRPELVARRPGPDLAARLLGLTAERPFAEEKSQFEIGDPWPPPAEVVRAARLRFSNGVGGPG